jgi:hypothetical protein
MSAQRFDNFGDLYRAAFAESDPEQKQVLLADVKNVLDVWAEADRGRADTPSLAQRPPVRVDRSLIKRVA